jgi:hypothetical protein
MGLFDIFSNDSAEKARDLANAGAQKGYDQLSGLYDQARSALTTGANTANGIWGGLGDYFNTTYGGGAKAYGDATGANGSDGYARAKTNFQTDPAYGFQMDQGLQALNRTHAAAGNLSSGNADTDTLKFATGLADQSYGNYVSRLAPYLQLAGTGATTAATGQSGVATGLASGLAGVFQNQGNAANTTQTTIGNNNAGAELNNYKVGANLWNGITGGLNFLSGGAGGAGGINGLVKNAGNLFQAFA